jgi:hypothetical protein
MGARPWGENQFGPSLTSIIVETFADQAVIAIEHVRLFEASSNARAS